MYYSKLCDRLSYYIDLDKQDVELVKTLFKYHAVEKGRSLVEQGKPVDRVFFILSGYLRYFKVIASGEEQVIHLYAPGHFATSLSGFFLGNTAKETLQAITGCEFLYISKPDLEKLYSTNDKWQGFGRKLMESFLIEKEERIIDQLSLTAHDKYVKLIENQPDIIQNVPVKYIASFIGVQPESLSRIRKEITHS